MKLNRHIAYLNWTAIDVVDGLDIFAKKLSATRPELPIP